MNFNRRQPKGNQAEITIIIMYRQEKGRGQEQVGALCNWGGIPRGEFNFKARKGGKYSKNNKFL